MNILFLTRRFWPDVGGVETHVLKVAEQLISQGHTVTVVTESSEEVENPHTEQKNLKSQTGYISAKMMGKDDLASVSSKTMYKSTIDTSISKKGSVNKNNSIGQEKLAHIIIYRLPKVNENRTKKLIIWKWFWKNRNLFKTADVIHCHDVFFWYLPFKFFDLSKKVYITFHGYEGVYPPAKKAVVIRKISEWLADGTICVGDYIKKWYGARPDFVTYGGVDSELSATGEKKNHTKGLRILFLGRLENDTGVPLYLAGLEVLRQMGFQFDFEACGDGSLREQVAEYGLVHGFVPNPDNYIKRADIIFASSYLSLLQALMYGKRVVAVYTNPLKEDYLKMAPFSHWINILSNKNDMINFFDQYEKNEARLKKMQQDGQAWAKEQTWENVTKLYVRLWRKNNIFQKKKHLQVLQ